MNRGILKGKDGVKILLEKLDKVYKKDRLTELYRKVRKMLNIERNKGETIRDYLIRYDKTGEECKALVGNMFQEEVKACHVIEKAKLTESQKQMILSACGKEKLSYDLVANIMRRVLDGMTQEEEREGEWWGADNWQKKKDTATFNRNTYTSNPTQYRRKNPIGRFGETTRCAICRSEYHWARECPDNFRNKRDKPKVESREEIRVKEDKGEKPKEDKEVKSYMASTVEDVMEERITAILDTGCKKTVCGEF